MLAFMLVGSTVTVGFMRRAIIHFQNHLATALSPMVVAGVCSLMAGIGDRMSTRLARPLFTIRHVEYSAVRCRAPRTDDIDHKACLALTAVGLQLIAMPTGMFPQTI